MKSISGMRGTIGGQPGDALTPVDLVQFATAYAAWLKNKGFHNVVVGRDGRTTGEPVKHIVIATLRLCGCNVIDLDLSTTPTVEMAVPYHRAGGGIILTASHNPAQWNALKFLNHRGEFISAEDGQWILNFINEGSFFYTNDQEMGSLSADTTAIQRHVQSIMDLDIIDSHKIKEKKYHVIVDPINSTGAIAIPVLLEKLGVTYEMIHHEVSGRFAHNPEPLPEHLEDLSAAVKNRDADLGISVDPDVDRLVLIGEDGSFFGEEYTLVAAADLVLRRQPGPTVSNLSSSRALTDLTMKYGQEHYQAAVGEVHVVQKMKEVNAVIGGEGNGGIIYPELHYGRDALLGIAMILQLLTEEGKRTSELRKKYRTYHMVKEKITLTHEVQPDVLLDKVLNDLKQNGHQCNAIDGVKIDFDEGWVHLRKSNTEPIIRLYTEGTTMQVCEKQITFIKNVMNRIHTY